MARNEAKSMQTVVKPSSPTQRPPHSAGGLAGDHHGRGAASRWSSPRRTTRPWPSRWRRLRSKPSSSSSSSAKAEGAIAVAALWSTSSSSMAKTSEPLSLSSSSKSLTASSWTVLSSESSSEQRDVDLEIGVVEDVLLALLDRGRGRRGERGLGLAAGRPSGRFCGLAGASDLSDLISSPLQGGQLDGVVVPQVEARRPPGG